MVIKLFDVLSRNVHYSGSSNELLFFGYDSKKFNEWYLTVGKILKIIGLCYFCNFPETLKENQENPFLDIMQTAWLIEKINEVQN